MKNILKSLIIASVITITSSSFAEDMQDIECVPQLNQSNPIPLGSKVLLIGDSHVGGLSYYFKKHAKISGYKPIVNYINGSLTSSLKKRLKDYLEEDLKLIIIVSGTNDAVLSEDKITTSLYKEVVDLATSKGAKLVWVSPPTDSDKLKSLDLVLASIKEATSNQYYFDSLSYSLDLSSDKIHLKPNGYSNLMDYIWFWNISNGLIIENC